MSDPHDFGPLSAGSTATDSGAGAEADLEAARLGVLLEIACDAVVAVDQDGVIVLVNERAEQMFGFARTELIGSLVEVLVPSHARASYVLERVAYVADPRPRRLEVTAARRDGSEFPVEITLNTLATAGGFLVVAAVREITERRLLDARSARLSAIVGYSRESIIAVSLNGVVTDWSAGAERMYGYSAAEAIGMPISLTHASAEQHELLGWILQRVAAGGSVDDLEMTHLAKDGRVICVSLSAWPVHDGHGRVVGASMIVRDITERMQAAVALVEAQDRFRYTFEDSPVGMAMLDLEFRYAQVNDAYCRLVGYTREQLLGTSVAAITHPEDIERDLDGMRATLHGSQGVYRAEKRYIHASGETIHVTLHAVLLRSREGAPLGFLSHAQDTTDHKRHERALHEELALLRSLLMEAVHAVVIVDQSGEIVLVNIAAEAMFGYRQEELVGEQVEILVPERFCESHEGERERFATGASTRAMGIGVELLARRKDGTEFPVEIGLSRVATGRGTLISAAISDITERERLDAEVAALAALVTSSDDAIIGKRLDGTITSWNPAAQRMYGHSAAEAVGRHIRMLCPSREQEHELDRVLGRVAAGEEVDHFETRRRRKNGGVIDVSVTISPIRNARGDVVGASTAARDISERKRAAAALSEAEERFRGAFEEAPIGMVMLTERMAVARVNAAMCRLLDRTEKEVVGRSILEFTHPDDVQHSFEWNDATIAGDVIPPLIKRYVRPDGSIREAQVTTALIEPPGSARYFFSQCEDVTARRRGERQKAAIADLGHRALQDGDVVALMGEAVRMIRQILATSVCIVSRCSGDGAVRLVAAHGESLGWTIGPGHPTQAAYTLALGKPVVSDDLLRETRFSAPPSVLERGMRRSLSVPVPDRSGARLVILTHGPASIAPLTIDDVRFVEMVAHVIAGALDRAASEDELRRRALEDPLTGLANRALLFSQLDAELRHARRLGNRVCVLVLDL
ncbi:MAG: PAS domain S-box protein, partial [Solirubrobacteraceae bacterium]